VLPGTFRSLTSTWLKPFKTSIQFLAIEFDDVPVRVEDVDLRVTRWGFRAKLHLSEIVVCQIAAEAFAAEPRYRIAIALYPQGKMNIGKINPLVAAKRRFRANQDVELRLSVAYLVPDPRMAEAVWAVEFLHFHYVSVELPRTFQVVNRNRKMMEAELVHSGTR
jgi:hypothetical protein